MEKSQNMLESDEILMSRHAAGDDAAFAALVRRHADPLLGFLFRMCGDRQRAEDLFQETFLRVHRKAASFDGKKPFKPWLYAIASNLAIDDHRHRVAFGYLEMMDDPENILSDVPDSSPLPTDDAIRVERKATVLDALEELPPRMRATVNLVYFEGMNYADAAAALNCSVGTVKTQMSRALTALARLLPATMTGGSP